MPSLMIPRGIIYHSVGQDLKNLFKTLFHNLEDTQKVEAFEKKFASYMGSKHSVAFPFARTAIYYALKLKNFEPGSEIIMPPITIKQILDVVLDLKLKPVFVDINPDTLCFDAAQLKQALTPKTKAVLVTYLFGMVPDLEEIMSLSKQNGLFVIEDFSQCLNGKFNGKKVGTFGDVGVYSSSSIKTLDTYGGGLLVTDNPAIFQELKKNQATLAAPNRFELLKKIYTDLARNVATQRWIFHFFVYPLLKLVSMYNPEETMKHLGTRNLEMIKRLPADWFTKFTSLQAEVGMELIEKVDTEDRIRRSNVEKIKLTSVKAKNRFPKGIPAAENVYWQFMAYFDKPYQIQKIMHSNKIDTSTTSLIHVANLPKYPYKAETPNARKLHVNGLFIPSYPGLSENDINHISRVINTIELE